MMKKTGPPRAPHRCILLFFFLFFAVLSCYPQSTDSPARIAVLPLEFEEGDERYGIIAATIFNTVCLTLTLMGSYEIVELDQAPLPEKKDLPELAAENSADSIISGRIDGKSGGSIGIEMSVFNRASRSVTLAKSVTAQSIFDIFDAADRIVVDLIEGFSGRHIAYGSLEIRPDFPEAGYSVYLNRRFIGRGVRDIPKLFIGEYELLVRQERGLGTEEIFRTSFSLSENENLRIDISVPHLTEKERFALESADAPLLGRHLEAELPDGGEFTALSEGFVQGISPVSGHIGSRYASLSKIATDIRLNYDADILRHWVNGDRSERFADLLPRNFAGVKTEGTASPVLPEAYAIARNDVEERRVPRVQPGVIKIDGDPLDWLFIPPTFIDSVGETPVPEADIHKVLLARDEVFFYVLFIVDEKATARAASKTSFQLTVSQPFGNYFFLLNVREGKWQAGFNSWDRASGLSTLLGRGNIRTGPGVIEASFPLDIVRKYLKDENKQSVGFQSRFDDFRDLARNKLLQLY